MALDIGRRAPAVTLFGPGRKPVHLGDHIGHEPVVLLFFPLAFTSTCREEMCTMAERYDAYSALDATVFAISVDSPHVNEKFAQETGAPFLILSDFNRDGIRAYDVVRPDLGGLHEVADRVVFVIDREGVIRWVWQGEHPGVLPPFDEIRAAVESLG